MAYENIRLRKQNFVMVDGYFYSIDQDTDNVVVKTDDGTQAYSYPLDTTITNQVVSLEHDGYNLWSLENAGAGANDVTIRRWYIDNYVCKLRDTFNLVESGSHKYESEAFTVEHYHIEFSGDEAIGQALLSITDGSELQSGYTVVLGPNSSGQIEEHTVNSAGADWVSINGTTAYAYSTGDPITFYKNIWLFNNYDGIDDSSGALYKINAYTGSFISKTAGGAYQDIEAATFFTIPAAVFGSEAHSICYIKATNMLFLDPDDLTTAYGSMTMDNIENDLATVISVYDLCFYGSNIYRLQLKATYYGETTAFDGGSYNYQLATLDSYITSISLRADPAILPANGVNTTTITAIVKDQFNLPIVSKLVYFTDDDSVGSILTSPVSTDGYGVAVTSYQAGTEAREVRITATAQQG
jgi:hypothetical protein